MLSFDPIGDGNELKQYLLLKFGWLDDGAKAVVKPVVIPPKNCYEQTFSIRYSDDINTGEVLAACREYYRQKSPKIGFYQKSCPMSRIRALSIGVLGDHTRHDSLIISNYCSNIQITITSYNNECPFALSQ